MSTTEERQDTEVIPEEEVSPAIAELGPQPQTDVPDSTPEVRLRTLTERGAEAYIKNKDKFCRYLDKQWSVLEKMCQEAGTTPLQIETLLATEESLGHAYNKYTGHADAYINFLKETRTEESFEDLDVFNSLNRPRVAKVTAVLKSLQDQQDISKRPKSVRSRSRRSSQSGSSNISDVSSLARRKRAKAEALKAKIAFIKKEAEIETREAQRRAEIEAREANFKAENEAREANFKAENEARDVAVKAELRLLESQREAAAAEAEARALEEDGSRVGDFPEHLPEETEDPFHRVQEFVNQQPEVTK